MNLPENHAYRVWVVQPDGRLRSMSRSYVWAQTSEAMCECCGKPLDAVNEEYSAGLHSHKSLEYLVQNYHGTANVYGIVYNHGVVLEAEQGYRSTKSTIRVLFTLDMELQARILQHYPDVTFAPAPIDVDYQHVKEYRDNGYQKTLARKALIKAAWNGHADRWGPERSRVLDCLRLAPGGMSYEGIVAFAKSYANSGEWLKRLWPTGKAQTTKFKPGDVVFEAGRTQACYIFIGSIRYTGDVASMRLVIGSDGLLYKKANLTLLEETNSWRAEDVELRKETLASWIRG